MRARLAGQHDGFTLVELLIVLAVISLLTAILLPALGTARSAARLAACGGNLRQIGIGIHAYAGDNGGFVPRGPDPRHAYDFSSNQMATNQIWSGEGTPDFPVTHPRVYFGLGQLLRTTCRAEEVFYCPADDNFNQQEEVPRIGSDAPAYASYLYRELDQLPAEAARGLLDRLGSNRFGDVLIRVETLALDTNSLGPGPYRHTNHGARWTNVLSRDGAVRRYANRANCLAIPPETFANPALIPLALDQLLTNADYAYAAGTPMGAPRVVALP